MSEPIQISEVALRVAEMEHHRTHHRPGYHVQKLLNAETDALRNQVHECGAMLQQRNKEIEELKDKLAIQIDCYTAMKYLHRHCEVSAGKAIHEG